MSSKYMSKEKADARSYLHTGCKRSIAKYATFSVSTLAGSPFSTNLSFSPDFTILKSVYAFNPP